MQLIGAYMLKAAYLEVDLTDSIQQTLERRTTECPARPDPCIQIA